MDNLNKIIFRHSIKGEECVPTKVDYFNTIRTDDAPIFLEDAPLTHRELDREKIKAFRKYRKLVDELTYKVVHLIPGIEKRGFWDHHVDHKISVWDGYHKRIPAAEIASIDNLQLIHWKENHKKGRKSIT